MAEKPKIDLKARLGKAQVGAGAPVPTATPVVPGIGRSQSSVPAPGMGGMGGSVPPPQRGGFSGSPAAGVPMPPFGGPGSPTTDAFGAKVAPTLSRAPAPQ